MIPFSNGSGPPLSPLQDSPGFLALQCLFPLSSLFLPIDSSTSVSVSSAVHLQHLLLFVVRPSEVYNPPADCQPNALLLVYCPADLRGFAPSPPPPPTCAAGDTWLGCGWRGEGDGAPRDGLEFLDALAGVAGIAYLCQRLRSLLDYLGTRLYVSPPPPPSPFPRTTVRVPIPSLLTEEYFHGRSARLRYIAISKIGRASR